MSSIVTKILNTTVGLLWNKARDTAAEKLKAGDVTDAQIRKILVRDLNDIKDKLECLSRKELLASYCFLQEGVGLLSVSIDKAKLQPKAKLQRKALRNEAKDDRGKVSKMTSSASETAMFNEALELSDAMRKLKINSDIELEAAKRRFEEARKTATHAFCNEALSSQDRIFAAKVRIISEILESLESPETAITGCLMFLEKLHSLPAIQETFSVYVNGGVKSFLNKAERVENVKSVMLINQVLSHYCSKFGSENYSYMVWPAIELADRIFNPVLDWQVVSTRRSMGNELIPPPNRVMLNEDVIPGRSVVNGLGEIIVTYCDEIRVVSKTGETKVVKLPDPIGGGKVIKQHSKALAVDSNNNVYVVKSIVTRTENSDVKSYVLYVLDEKYNVKHTCTLDFLKVTRYLNIAVNKNNDLILIKDDEPFAYVFDDTGKLKHKFERNSRWARSLCISDNNEIMMLSKDGQAVDVYTEAGERQSTIKVPEGHEVTDVAFHHTICKIIVLTYVEKTDSHFLMCFSGTGELETSTFFGKYKYAYPAIPSHPSGPVAAVTVKMITFI